MKTMTVTAQGVGDGLGGGMVGRGCSEEESPLLPASPFIPDSQAAHRDGQAVQWTEIPVNHVQVAHFRQCVE